MYLGDPIVQKGKPLLAKRDLGPFSGLDTNERIAQKFWQLHDKNQLQELEQ